MLKADRLFVGTVAAFGIATLFRSVALFDAQVDLAALAYAAGTLFSSGLKVSLPIGRGTMSVSFVFLILAAIELAWQEAILIGFASVLLQYCWQAKEKRRLIKLGFNCGNIFLSLTTASAVYSWDLLAKAGLEPPIRVVASALAYFMVNTAIVALAMALTESRPVLGVWRGSLAWFLPHYLAGAVLIAVFLSIKNVVGWQTCGLIFPVIWVFHRTYRLYISRLEAEQRSAQLKGQFLANMSHELRTPMNSVMSLSALLVDEPDLPAKHKESVELIRQSSAALLAVIDDILDVSAMEAGKLRIKPSPTRLRVSVGEVLRFLQIAADKKGLDLRVEYAAGVPDALVLDQGRLRQILLNLVGNAIKFTDRGSVMLRIRMAEESNHILFEVVDSGIGIREEKIKGLFEPFSQVDNSDRRGFGGTGLGLSIAKRLVEAMGGAIGVHSRPGQGCTFWFQLPVQIVTGEPEPLLQSTGFPARREMHSNNGPVLVVEDNPINQRVAVSLLQKLGYDSSVAENGAKAVELVQTTRYAVILMDCQMPVMDGFEATEAIRRNEQGYRTPIIALTAGALHDDGARCIAAGMGGFLRKPVNIALLVKTLEEWSRRPTEHVAATAR